jgi:hypothetical protein
MYKSYVDARPMKGLSDKSTIHKSDDQESRDLHVLQRRLRTSTKFNLSFLGHAKNEISHVSWIETQKNSGSLVGSKVA